MNNKPIQNEIIDTIDDIILGTNEIVHCIEDTEVNKVKHVPKSEVANTGNILFTNFTLKSYQ